MGPAATRRGIAACVCAWMVLCCVLEAHHVASVGHVRLSDGTVVHVHPQACSHDQDHDGNATFQGAAEQSADHVCSLSRVVQSPLSSPGVATATSLPPSWSPLEGAIAAGRPRPSQLLLIAPKTSPPDLS